MWNCVINIHLGELLHTKTKESRINDHKNFFLKIENLYFLPNNILTIIFKELKNTHTRKIYIMGIQ